jgi:hypothetical protein
MRMHPACFALAALPFLAPSLAAQPATLVYRLGTDTVAIEQYTRTGNRLSGEMVQRSGAAIARVRYDVTTGNDGRPVSATFVRLQADGTPVPNAPTETRFRFGADSVVREVAWPDSVQRRAFAAKQAVVNFPTYVYGPMELLAAVRRGGVSVDSLPAIGPAGNLGFAGLQAAGGDTVRVRGGQYAMLMRFDGNGRLQSVDGRNTTNKITATRGSRPVDIAAIARTMKPTGTLSTRDVARASFGPGGMVLVDYGRPLVRERTVWGGTLVPFDSVWRAGANDATHLFTTRVLTMGDVVLQPGMYTLWVQHTRGGTFLIVSRGTGQWGTQYDAKQDVGRVPMTMTATPGHVETFTVAVRASGANRGAIEMSWGPGLGTVPFTVSPARPQ